MRHKTRPKRKIEEPEQKMMSETAWKLVVSKANDSTKDGAPNDVWDKINSENWKCHEADEDEARCKEIE